MVVSLRDIAASNDESTVEKIRGLASQFKRGSCDVNLNESATNIDMQESNDTAIVNHQHRELMTYWSSLYPDLQLLPSRAFYLKKVWDIPFPRTVVVLLGVDAINTHNNNSPQRASCSEEAVNPSKAHGSSDRNLFPSQVKVLWETLLMPGMDSSVCSSLQQVLALWPSSKQSNSRKLAVLRSMRIDTCHREKGNQQAHEAQLNVSSPTTSPEQNGAQDGACERPVVTECVGTSRCPSTTSVTHELHCSSHTDATLYWPAYIKHVYGVFEGGVFEDSVDGLCQLQQYDRFEDVLRQALASPMRICVDVIYAIDEVSERHHLTIAPAIVYSSDCNKVPYDDLGSHERHGGTGADNHVLTPGTFPQVVSICNYNNTAGAPQRGQLSRCILAHAPISLHSMLDGPICHSQSVVFLRPTPRLVCLAQQKALLMLEDLWKRLRQSLPDRLTAIGIPLFENEKDVTRAAICETAHTVLVLDPLTIEPAYMESDVTPADAIPTATSPLARISHSVEVVTRLPRLQSHYGGLSQAFRLRSPPPPTSVPPFESVSEKDGVWYGRAGLLDGRGQGGSNMMATSPSISPKKRQRPHDGTRPYTPRPTPYISEDCSSTSSEKINYSPVRSYHVWAPSPQKHYALQLQSTKERAQLEVLQSFDRGANMDSPYAARRASSRRLRQMEEEEARRHRKTAPHRLLLSSSPIVAPSPIPKPAAAPHSPRSEVQVDISVPSQSADGTPGRYPAAWFRRARSAGPQATVGAFKGKGYARRDITWIRESDERDHLKECLHNVVRRGNENDTPHTPVVGGVWSTRRSRSACASAMEVGAHGFVRFALCAEQKQLGGVPPRSGCTRDALYSTPVTMPRQEATQNALVQSVGARPLRPSVGDERTTLIDTATPLAATPHQSPGWTAHGRVASNVEFTGRGRSEQSNGSEQVLTHGSDKGTFPYPSIDQSHDRHVRFQHVGMSQWGTSPCSEYAHRRSVSPFKEWMAADTTPSSTKGRDGVLVSFNSLAEVSTSCEPTTPPVCEIACESPQWRRPRTVDFLSVTEEPTYCNNGTCSIASLIFPTSRVPCAKKVVVRRVVRRQRSRSGPSSLVGMPE